MFEQRDEDVFGARTIDATGKDRESREVKLIRPDPYMTRGSSEHAVRDGDKLVWSRYRSTR